jgi:branched-chain amino acid transport system ATP-binding protein/urea transport system ATP-binding protein
MHQRARNGIAYVPQGRDIFPALSVLDNLKAAAFGIGRSDWPQAVAALLDEFPMLRDKRDARGSSLSGGQQQILALARALVTRPTLLLLDEPSEGIQPSIVEQIAQTIREINRREGIAVVVVEQNLDFVARMAAHCHLVDKGRIVFDCPADRIVNDAVLQRQYLGV